jgi:cell division septation protein DedD
MSTLAIQKTIAPQKTNTLPVKEEVSKDTQNKKVIKPAAVTLASSKPPVTANKYQENYTIQVATYKSKTNAQKEVQLLKNKGFQPLVFSKDSHIQLCVGQYLSKDQAQASIKELKKFYQDCFLRRL